MRHSSLKGPVSVKRHQANSVKTRLPPIDGFRCRSTNSRYNQTPDDLGWVLLDSYNVSLSQVGPLPVEFFGLQVCQDKFTLEKN